MLQKRRNKGMDLVDFTEKNIRISDPYSTREHTRGRGPDRENSAQAAASDFPPVSARMQMGAPQAELSEDIKKELHNAFPKISTKIRIDEKAIAQEAANQEKEVLESEKKDALKSGEYTAQHPNMKHGAYGAKVSALDINRHLWEDTGKGAWADSPTGRLVIRLFSRGVLGAACFTAGGLMTRKWLGGENQYNPLKSFAEQKNPLQLLAKSIDTVVGKPIQTVVTKIAGEEAGLASVRFRPTRYATFANNTPGGIHMRGRSLGDEVVNITFDFFSASVGDAFGRDIASALDPNVDKTYIDDKGHFKPGEFVKSAAKSAFRYVTYNGGEDWAVAIPYAYMMKGQRHILNKASPGFQHDFDRQLNGGSFKMDGNKIVGNYNKTGALDLQSRFTFYNIGTLMYREAYDYIGNKLLGNDDVRLYGSRDDDATKKTLLDSAGDVAKWAMRSAVKGTIIMTPSVPFFWATRTPQTKHRALFIDPNKGTLGVPPGEGLMAGDSIHANASFKSASRNVDYWQYQHKPHEPYLGKHGVADGHTTIGQISTDFVGGKFDAHKRTFGPVDSALNALGEANYTVARATVKPSEWLDKRAGPILDPIHKVLGISGKGLGTGRFMRPMVYASASYTPYMYAKSEAANLWDNGKMDLAAERLIDGATKLNWGEFKKGAGEVYNTVLNKPLQDTNREIEAQRRMWLDTSPADQFETTQAQQYARKHQIPVQWRDKVFSGPTVRSEKGDPLQNENIARHISKKKTSYTEHEELRKMLEELNPPTNSIN